MLLITLCSIDVELLVEVRTRVTESCIGKNKHPGHNETIQQAKTIKVVLVTLLSLCTQEYYTSTIKTQVAIL